MRHVETNGGEIFIFDSLGDLTDYIDPNRFEDKGDASFVGAELPTWRSVQDKAISDWQEGLEALEEYVKKIGDADIPEVRSHRRKVVFDEFDGDEIDYDRLRAGQDYWRVSRRETTEGPTTMTVVIDTSTRWNQRSMNILWRGAAAIALTKILEEKGYSVELWVAEGSTLFSGKNTRVMSACCLKRCSDPLDVSTAINAVSGWFYRTAFFALNRTICDKQGEGVAYGLGSVASPTQDDLDAITTDELRVYSSGVYSFDAALSMVIGELERINRVEEGATP